MTTPAGVGAQLGYITETTVGEAETVDTFLPFNSENVKQNIERLDSMGLRAGRFVTAAWKPGASLSSGTVEMELWNTDIATLFKHAFGSVTTATNGAQWDYTFTPSDLSGTSFTLQIGRPDIDGTVQAFTYDGCKIGQWTLSSELNSIATLSLDVVAMTETTGTSLETASYDSSLAPFVFTEASLSIGGTTNNVVHNVELVGNNNLTSRPRQGQSTSREYLANGFREYTGSATIDFGGLTQYNRFVNGDEAALELLFDNGTETLTVTANVRFNGETPEVAGPELLTENAPFKCVSATSDASAITAVLTNAEGLSGAD